MSISTRSFKIAGGRYPTMLPAIVTFTSRFSIGPLLQICARPPSTNNSIPVIKLLSSDARNVTAFATSSGLPILPSVMVLRELILHLFATLTQYHAASHRCVYRTRTDGVDADLALLQIDSPGTREGSDGGLGCAVNTGPFESFG